MVDAGREGGARQQIVGIQRQARRAGGTKSVESDPEGQRVERVAVLGRQNRTVSDRNRTDFRSLAKGHDEGSARFAVGWQ